MHARQMFPVAASLNGFGTLDGSPWGSDGTLGSKSVYPNGYNSMRWVSKEWDTEFATALLQPDQATQAPHFKRCSEIFNPRSSMERSNRLLISSRALSDCRASAWSMRSDSSFPSC